MALTSCLVHSDSFKFSENIQDIRFPWPHEDPNIHNYIFMQEPVRSQYCTDSFS